MPMADSGPDKESFVRNDQGDIIPVIENFYRFCGQKKLMAVRWSKCNA